jgi:hypothetical protein
MLQITISIGDISTDLTTDVNMSFDAIETLLTRAAQTTLQAYLSLPPEDRLASFGLEDDDGDDDS